jgi:hypothetical protein
MKIIKIILVVILALILIIIVSTKITKYRQLVRPQVSNAETQELITEIEKLAQAFKNNDVSAVYYLFNSSFQDESSLAEFSEAFLIWLNQRKFIKMDIQNLRIVGRIGHVSSKLRFSNKTEAFLYQSWIKTGQGWKIIWLNRLLPHDMLRYGDSHKYDVQLIKQRSLDELFTNKRISLITNELELPEIIFIQTDQERKQPYFSLPDYTVKEVSADEIVSQAQQTEALFWLEFATIRIIDDIASIYIDIHPLYHNIPVLSRTRGIQLFFIQKNGHWDFDSSGASW